MLPGIDMLRLFLIRIKNKKNPFSGDRKHLHHFLFKRLNKRKTTFTYFLLFITPIFFLYFKILSENYITSNSLYKWECKNMRIFEKSWIEMKRASWFCIKCNKDNEITIDKLKKFAKEKNGECI